MLFVELFLDEGGDVFLDVVLLESLRGAVDGILLHVLGHVGILDDNVWRDKIVPLGLSW